MIEEQQTEAFEAGMKKIERILNSTFVTRHSSFIYPVSRAISVSQTFYYVCVYLCDSVANIGVIFLISQAALRWR